MTLITRVLKQALAKGDLQAEEVFSSIDENLRKVREEALVAQRRAQDGPKDWLKTKLATVVALLDAMIPADPEGANLATRGSRIAHVNTAEFLATSDGVTYDIRRIRHHLREGLPALQRALLLANAAEWQEAPQLYALSQALHEAIGAAE